MQKLSCEAVVLHKWNNNLFCFNNLCISGFAIFRMAPDSTLRVSIEISFDFVVLCFLVDYFDLSILLYIIGSGATNPEYVVTADDVDKLIAVECIPMDDQGRQVYIWNHDSFKS